MGKRILIVDDAMFMRACLRSILMKGGYQIVGEAANGVESIELYRSVKPDLVTMDLRMPEMDGLTALREIRRFDPQASIVVCSAMGQRTRIQEALDSGARDYLLKPFEPTQVIDLIDRLMAA